MLAERGFDVENVAGTAAGAITAAFSAPKYSVHEMRDIIMSLDYGQFEDKGWEDKLPFFEKTVSLLRDLGLYEGDRFLEWMRGMLAAKNVRTFGNLVREEETDIRFRYKLQVIASDVTTHEMLVLPRDAAKLGVDPDELGVAEAVRMSMSIPIFFEPWRHVNPKTNRTHIIVDGGMLSNFPVWLFDCGADEEPDWPTFGLLLVEPEPRKTTIGDRLPAPERPPRGVGAFLNYAKSLAQTMMEAHDRMYVEKADYARTIAIPTLGVGTTEFEIRRERALALFDSGRKAAEEFLADWDFEAYIEKYRKGKAGSRRRDIVEEMAAAKRGAAASGVGATGVEDS